jgi:hypothetical protein
MVRLEKSDSSECDLRLAEFSRYKNRVFIVISHMSAEFIILLIILLLISPTIALIVLLLRLIGVV